MERYQGRIHGTCIRLVGNPTEAMDLSQQTFLEAYRALPRFDLRRSFSSWLVSIAINNCKDFLKSHKRRESQLGPEGDVSGAMFTGRVSGPGETVERREALRQVAAALQGMDDKYRVPLVLKDVEGLDYKEMHRLLELPITTLKMRVVRARKQLVESLGWTEDDKS